jgi:hypothetical protein
MVVGLTLIKNDDGSLINLKINHEIPEIKIFGG